MAGYLYKKEWFHKKGSRDKSRSNRFRKQYSLFPIHMQIFHDSQEYIGEIFLWLHMKLFVDPRMAAIIIPYKMNIPHIRPNWWNFMQNQGFVSILWGGDKRVEEKEYYYTDYTAKFIDETIVLEVTFYINIWYCTNLNGQQVTLMGFCNFVICRSYSLIYARSPEWDSRPTVIRRGMNKIEGEADFLNIRLSKDNSGEAVGKRKWHD